MFEYKVQDIVKIYDGDTITVNIDLGFNIVTKRTFRLWGIDTPEVRGEEREDGLVARDWLRQRLYLAYETDKTITIKTIKDKKGKYGRWLGIVYIDDININEQLMFEGFAIPYMRGKK